MRDSSMGMAAHFPLGSEWRMGTVSNETSSTQLHVVCFQYSLYMIEEANVT